MSELLTDREALAKALLSSHVSEWDGAYWVCSCGSRLVDWAEANGPLKVSLASVHDRWMGGHQVDALLESGVVQVVPTGKLLATDPDHETVCGCGARGNGACVRPMPDEKTVKDAILAILNAAGLDTFDGPYVDDGCGNYWPLAIELRDDLAREVLALFTEGDKE